MAEDRPARPPDNREEMLAYKVKNLGVRVEEQRREIRVLEAKVDEYDRQQEEYQETLMCVNRLWHQLNQDILFLVARSTGRDALGAAVLPKQEPGGAASPTNGPTAADHPAKSNANGDDAPLRDIFMDKLLHGGGGA